MISLLDSYSKMRPLNSILFEDREEHNELRITPSGTFVTDGRLLDSALNQVPWSLLTSNPFANPALGVNDRIDYTAIDQ